MLNTRSLKNKMGKIYSIDDIEKRKEAENREKFKRNAVMDVNDIFEGIFKPKRKPEKEKKFSLLKWIGILLLLLIMTTLIYMKKRRLKIYGEDFLFIE